LDAVTSSSQKNEIIISFINMIRHYRTGSHSDAQKQSGFRSAGIICLFLMLFAIESSAQITFKQSIGTTGTAVGQFDGPFGTAISKTGDLYVTDYRNHRVQVFDDEGVFKFAFGSEGTADGSFKHPNDVAFHENGELYVLQSDRVQVFSAEGVFIRKFSVSSAHGLAMDPMGDIFVIGSFEVMKFNVEGQLQKQWGTYGKATGQFDNAYKGVVDRDGRLYVVELFNHRIQVFMRDGEFITSIGSEGSGDGQLKHPSGIALDGAGNIYVADQGNNRIQVFNLSGAFLRKFGSAGSTEGKFQNPVRVTLDAYGKIFVSDHSNNRVQVFSKSANEVTGFDNIEKTYGDESFILFAQSSSSAPIWYSEVVDENTTGDVSLDGFAVVINKAGVVKLRAHAGDDLETAGATKEIILTIHKANQSIAFDPLPTKIFGTGNVPLPLLSSAGLDISYSSTNESVATVEGNTITLVGAGETTIVASQAGDDNYQEAENVERVLVVQMITDAEADQNKIFTIHPNPTVDFLVVEAKANGSLYLMDYTGKSVMESMVASHEPTTLDLRPLPAGVYYVKISNDSANSFKRVVRK
jgi:sugar lactone lactonase YvrE